MGYNTERGKNREKNRELKNMKTENIRHALQLIARKYKQIYKKKLYFDVCACDLLPKKLPLSEDVCLIINTDISALPGKQ